MRQSGHFRLVTSIDTFLDWTTLPPIALQSSSDDYQKDRRFWDHTCHLKKSRRYWFENSHRFHRILWILKDVSVFAFRSAAIPIFVDVMLFLRFVFDKSFISTSFLIISTFFIVDIHRYMFNPTCSNKLSDPIPPYPILVANIRPSIQQQIHSAGMSLPRGVAKGREFILKQINMQRDISMYLGHRENLISLSSYLTSSNWWMSAPLSKSSSAL